MNRNRAPQLAFSLMYLGVATLVVLRLIGIV